MQPSHIIGNSRSCPNVRLEEETCVTSLETCRADQHVLAVVHLVGDDRTICLDRSELFLIPHTDVSDVPDCCDRLDHRYSFSEELVAEPFG